MFEDLPTLTQGPEVLAAGGQDVEDDELRGPPFHYGTDPSAGGHERLPENDDAIFEFFITP